MSNTEENPYWLYKVVKGEINGKSNLDLEFINNFKSPKLVTTYLKSQECIAAYGQEDNETQFVVINSNTGFLALRPITMFKLEALKPSSSEAPPDVD